MHVQEETRPPRGRQQRPLLRVVGLDAVCCHPQALLGAQELVADDGGGAEPEREGRRGYENEIGGFRGPLGCFVYWARMRSAQRSEMLRERRGVSRGWVGG